MVQKNVTLSLDENVYDHYKEFCKKNAIALSRSDDFAREPGELREPALFSISLSGSPIEFDGGTGGTDSNESSNESRLIVRDSQQEEPSTGLMQYQQLSFF